MPRKKKPIPNRNRGRIAQPSHMPRQEFSFWLATYGLDYLTGARFLRMHPRSVLRMIRGEVPIDARTAMLLRLMVKTKISPAKVAELLSE